MSNNKNIPYEVLRQIFKYAVKNSNNRQRWLAQYQLVCKSWTQAARDCLYISVKFDNYLVLMDFIHSMQNCHVGHLTRTIILGDHDKPMNQLAASFISELAKICPNVDRIKGRLTGVLAWHALEKVASTNWIGLKELLTPVPSYSDYTYGRELYHELSMDNRSTLTRFHLPPELLSSQFLTRTINQLKFFSNLTHLVIEHAYHYSSLLDYDETIQSCPNLTSLTIYNSKIEAFQSLASSNSRSYNIHSMQSHTRVKKLKLVSFFEENLFFYIMHKFPNLETLHIHFYPDLDMSPIDENSAEDNYYKENGDAIMQYLSKLQYYKIRNQSGLFVIKKYLKHTPNAHIDLSIIPGLGSQVTLTKNTLIYTLDTRLPEREEKFKQAFKKHYQNISAFSLHLLDDYENPVAWTKYIHATCTEMKHFNCTIYDD